MRRSPLRGLLTALGWTIALTLLPSCREVRFYQKRAFSQRVMNLADDPTHIHFQQKVFYSIEGAAGGLGTSAGGGCGCY